MKSSQEVWGHLPVEESFGVLATEDVIRKLAQGSKDTEPFDSIDFTVHSLLTMERLAYEKVQELQGKLRLLAIKKIMENASDMPNEVTIEQMADVREQLIAVKAYWGKVIELFDRFYAFFHGDGNMEDIQLPYDWNDSWVQDF